VQCVYDLVKRSVTRDENKSDTFCALGWSEAVDVREKECADVPSMLCRSNFIGCKAMGGEKREDGFCCQLSTLTVSARWVVHDNERHLGRRVRIDDKIR